MIKLQKQQKPAKKVNIKGITWTVFFSLMYPILIIFALLTSTLITITSFLSISIYKILKKF
jgi:hypothetical protein